jgi:NAD(P)-dependent dehydrogenase (short-subunit alcohol dehydrogenase family)
MNNAGIRPGSSMFGPGEAWRRILEVNLWVAIHWSRIFAPRVIANKRPAMIINTGSKQGITTPPGDPAYNLSAWFALDETQPPAFFAGIWTGLGVSQSQGRRIDQ